MTVQKAQRRAPAPQGKSGEDLRQRFPSKLRKTQILDAALRLFHKKGFLGTSVTELANAVGVSKATLYYHIGSKEKVLYEIHERFMDEGLRLLAELDEKNIGATDKLAEFTILQCQMTHRHQLELSVVMSDLDRLSDRPRRAMVKKRDEYMDFLVKIIDQGVSSGEFHRMDSRLCALALIGMMNWLHRWYNPKGPATPEQIGALMAAIVIDGVSTNPAGARSLWSRVDGRHT